MGFGGNDAGWRAFGEFKKSAFGKQYFRDGLKPAPDGTFSIPNVLAGTYQLFVTAPNTDNYAGSTRFTVPMEKPNGERKPVDVGEVKLKPEKSPSS